MHRIEAAGFEVAAVAHLLPKNEESLVANREKWASKRREHLQLIVRPLDCREGVSKRDDFLAVMKGAPTDKDVRKASRLKRADIGSRDVSTKIAEPAEENRDVTRPNGDRAAVLFDRPATLIDQPSNESSDRLREGFHRCAN